MVHVWHSTVSTHSYSQMQAHTTDLFMKVIRIHTVSKSISFFKLSIVTGDTPNDIHSQGLTKLSPIQKNKFSQPVFEFTLCIYFSAYWPSCWPWWLSWIRRPTGDQEVGGSAPAEVGNILSWRLIMKYFLRSFSPFR